MPIVPLKSRRAFAGAALTALGVVLFCRLLLQRNPGLFFNDDYQLSILPVFADVARSWNEGHWPLLSPFSWACNNLAGEYQYGTFSAFVNGVVVVVWKCSLTFAQQAAALSVTHLAVLSAGTYLLASERRLPASLATGVAFVAALNGWEMGWGATDWFGALAAHAWLPWCWWAFEVALRAGGDAGYGIRDAGCEGREGPHAKAQRRKGEKRKKGEGGRGLKFLLPAPFVYLLLTGGFPYTVVMLGLVTAFLAWRTWWEHGGVWRTLRPLLAGWGLGGLLAAPALLSLVEAVHGSGRSQQGVGVGNFAWTVPLSSLPGLLLPNWTVLWQDFANLPCAHGALELAGGFVPTVGLLAGLACLRGKAVRALRWDLGLLGIVLLLCLLPSPGLFRWSFRWLPLLHIVLALTGARALQLLASRTRGFHWRQNPGLWASGGVLLAWGAMRTCRTGSPDPLTDAIPPFMLAVGLGWAALDALPILPRGWKLWGAGLATVASLWGTYRYAHTNTGLPIYPAEQNLTRIEPLSTDRLYLSLYREPDRFYRVFQVPPGFGAVVRMGSMGMYAGVRMLNGYSPIMSEGVGKAFQVETHGNVPEAAGERLLREEAGADGLLARLGVDAIVLTHDYQTPARPPADEWERVAVFDEADVYHRRGGSLPAVRAWTSAEPGAPARYAPASVRVVENTRQRVEVEVMVPAGGSSALVAFSRPFSAGYTAALNGQELKVGSFRGLLPTVEVPAGSRGRLTLSYRPRAVKWGAALAAVGLLAGLGLAVRSVWRRQGNDNDGVV